MKTGLSIILSSALILLITATGCEPATRYRVLCFLFDGVPPPEGIEPCDGSVPGTKTKRDAKARKPGEEQKLSRYTEHGPYAAKMCDGCHQKQTNNLVLPVEKLCTHCHDVFEVPKRRVHGPVAAGSCIVCHNPHGSGNAYLLVSKAEEFCLYCHLREDILSNQAHQSIDLNCSDCHNAHATDNDFMLR